MTISFAQEERSLIDEYITPLYLLGYEIRKNKYYDCHALVYDKYSKNISFVNIYNKSFDIFLTKTSFISSDFKIKLMRTIKNLGLSINLIEASRSHQIFEVIGNIDLLIKLLFHIEEEIMK